MSRSAGHDMATPLLTLDDLQALHDEICGLHQYHRDMTGLSPSGDRPSRWHGQGMEAIDSRPYQPGDDIRHMDWRATARSGRPHSRVFQDERQRSLFLVIDLRSTMYFASRGELKARRALRCAALLGLATISRREPVAGLVITDDAIHIHPPAKGLPGLADLVLGGSHDRAASLPPMRGLFHGSLDRLSGILPVGASLIFLSDLNETLGREQETLMPLLALAQRHTCHVIHIRDEAEHRLPAVGRVRLTGDGGLPIEIDTHDATLRTRYEETIREHVAALDTICLSAAIQRTPMDTTEPVLERLRDLIG